MVQTHEQSQSLQGGRGGWESARREGGRVQEGREGGVGGRVQGGREGWVGECREVVGGCREVVGGCREGVSECEKGCLPLTTAICTRDAIKNPAAAMASMLAWVLSGAVRGMKITSTKDLQRTSALSSGTTEVGGQGHVDVHLPESRECEVEHPVHSTSGHAADNPVQDLNPATRHTTCDIALAQVCRGACQSQGAGSKATHGLSGQEHSRVINSNHDNCRTEGQSQPDCMYEEAERSV